MSDPDKNDSGLGQWLPIQIAPDDCDLELGRPHKTGILPLTICAGAAPGIGGSGDPAVRCEHAYITTARIG
ncbi:hypothetical protein [Bradyrhizobium sp. 930_D9_N1_4]|uniref:hypothetical protein n=1 Tax=Bradyrhizobium sp. 930_D9_N1_4 TaxID=3240374 RepID=UPI003F8CEE4D